jgi:hypothetical protein
VAFIILFLLCHSCIWSNMWVALSYLSVNNTSVPTLYRNRSWKWLRKTSVRSWKVWKVDPCNSMYHFTATPARVQWKSHNRMEFLFNEFEENHRWNIVTWSLRSSPYFPSNLGMYEDNLLVIEGQFRSWHIDSIISFNKSSKFNIVRKGSLNFNLEFQLPRLGASGWLATGRGNPGL